MKADDPRHGTHPGYNQHIRDGETACDACRNGTNRYNTLRMMDVRRNGPRTVELGAAALAIVNRAPLQYLSEVSGIGRENLSRIQGNGTPEQKVFRSTRNAILRAGRRAYWSQTGIQRRLQALHALGWGAAAIHGAGGPSKPTIARWLHATDPSRIEGRTPFALQVIEVYETLSMQLPPTRTPHQRTSRTKALLVANAHGWAPPLAWGNIDDPSESPMGVRVAHAGAGRPDVMTARIENAEWLADADMTLSEVLERLGVKHASFRDQCSRAGRSDLYWRLANREPNGEMRRTVRDELKRKREVA